MTICIASICDAGLHIVVAADRMFTASDPVNLEFETEETKIEILAPSCIVLSSGNSSFATEVLEPTRQLIGGSLSPAVADVANHVLSEYTKARSQKVDELIVGPSLGPDYQDFLARGGNLPTYLQVQPQTYQQIVAFSQQYNMELDFIVAGIDSSGTFISRVTHPGTLVRLDKLGYDAIGSGALHALTKLYLGAQTIRRGLVETLYGVYEAKKSAEVAPGVGRVTDIGIISATGGLWLCEATVLAELDQLFAGASTRAVPDFTQLGDLYEQARIHV